MCTDLDAARGGTTVGRVILSLVSAVRPSHHVSFPN